MTNEPDEDDETTTVGHDIHGLDLARQIAAKAAGTSGTSIKNLRKRGKPKVEPIGDVLAEFISVNNWSTQLSVQQILTRWPELVGEVNAGHSKPEAYAGHILTIRAESTVWASSLRQIAPQIVAILNEKLGQGVVTRVVVIGPNAPSWKHGKRSVPGRGTRDTYG
ncbi:MAG: DciA family protein [Propionibacteriaceae bacterium]|jgi:predicted nucleic acid-binding Zn ribbon protein|nr:DciA family protein [Propionibacteriaceae bacterium]